MTQDIRQQLTEEQIIILFDNRFKENIKEYERTIIAEEKRKSDKIERNSEKSEIINIIKTQGDELQSLIKSQNSELKNSINKLDEKIENIEKDILELKQDVKIITTKELTELKTEIEKTKTWLLLRIGGAVVTIIGIGFAFLKFFPISVHVIS